MKAITKQRRHKLNNTFHSNQKSKDERNGTKPVQKKESRKNVKAANKEPGDRKQLMPFRQHRATNGEASTRKDDTRNTNNLRGLHLWTGRDASLERDES